MKHIKQLYLLILLMIVGNVMALGEETQKKYGFATKSWGVFEGAGDWTSGKDGNQYTSGRGVQVTTAASGANATSPISFNNISRIDVIYSTNASKGKGTISLQVGSNTSKSFTVTSSGGTTDRTASFEYSPNESGSVKITVTCSENSIYIKSVTITYSDSSPSGTVSTPTFSPGAGEVTPGTEVFFNCNTEGVTYYYTTDGTEPTTSSTSGTSYIVNSGVTLKVIAVKEGMNNSQVATATYTIAKNDPELAFSETSVTANYGESFTPPTLTHAEGYDGTITYSSSNSAITVDSSTGAITFDASAVGKTTTITATASETDNYRSGTATYVLSVVNPNAITGNLNNATFGTNYGGTITPIASFTSVSGTIGSGDKVVTVTYSKGTSSNAYINNSEIRLYNGSLLTFEAPEGYAILSLVFNTTLTACQPIDDIGSISGNTWSAPNDENVTNVSITKTTSGGLALNKVDITLIALGTAVPKPTISPASGTYTEAQTVTITNNAEGATVYYTTDGTTPTTSSTVYSAPFTLSSNGTYEVKAIAVVDGNSSSVATSTITIQIYVEAPTINPADGTQITEETSISISTAAADLTIYYTTDSTDPVKNGELTSSAKAYNGAFTLSKAGTVKAVAMNSDGVFSEIVSATYTYNGTVTAPYYENFDEGLGNFTVETSGTNPPVWIFQETTNTATYGTRKYAYVNGSNKTGTARLISPVIDLTDETITTVTLSFIHAGRYFDGFTTTDYTPEQTAAGNAPSHAQVFVREEGGEWQQFTIPNWFSQAGEGHENIYERTNSGDINLNSFAGTKIQVSFLYTADGSNTGTNSTGIWNVLKFALTTENFEVVNMKTDGFATYVVKNDIDWKETLLRNEERDGKKIIDIHGYKVTEFSKTSATFVEYGYGGNEEMIPAETPIIMKGKMGDNYLVIAKHDDVIDKPASNLLLPSYGDVKPTDDQHLLVLQKTSDWNAVSPYENYAFFKVKTGRVIPDRKAYLNGTNLSETITTQTNPAKGIFTLEDLSKDYEISLGVVNLKPARTESSGSVFDLSGRKVAADASTLEKAGLQKGIYIVNGHKVVIK